MGPAMVILYQYYTTSLSKSLYISFYFRKIYGKICKGLFGIFLHAPGKVFFRPSAQVSYKEIPRELPFWMQL